MTFNLKSTVKLKPPLISGLGGDPCGYSCQAATPNMAEIYNQTQIDLNKLRAAPTVSTGNNGVTPILRNIAKDVRGGGHPPSALASVGRLVREAIRRSRESEESAEVTTVGSAEEIEVAGVPRSEVCPTLCLNGLGE